MDGFALTIASAVLAYVALAYGVWRVRPAIAPQSPPSDERGLLALAACFWFFGHLGAFVPWAATSILAAHTVTAIVRAIGVGLILLCIAHPAAVGFQRPRPLWLPGWALGCFVLYLPILILLSRLRSDVVDQDAVQQVQAASDGLTQVALFVSLVLVTPLFEEVLFRGLLQRAAIYETGPVAGVLLTSLVFMVVHPRGVWLDVFSLALLLGCLYHYTRNLWVPITIHVAHNALAYTIYS